ncbi:DNA-directed RNA polymerase III subunit C4 [Ceratobasidium sp. AG-Ba]|nr:DNA-directed RNA polymerase III subunit C4 [Ceratobasidium sp. AG-Ba]
MSDGKAGESSNQGASSSNTAAPRPLGTLRNPATTQPASRAIGNVLNRRPTEGTGTGRAKMMFMPNKVVRRKLEDGVIVKQEPSAVTVEPAGPGRGAGGERGHSDGRGRGRGRGAPPPTEMVASGPFALGPAANSTRRPTRISAVSAPPPGHGGAPPPGGGLTDTAAPTLEHGSRKLQKKRVGLEAAEKEQYSDDEGVEVVDMDDVNELDWMAPDSLIRVKEEDEEKAARKRDKLKGKIKDKGPSKMKLDPEDDARVSESLLSSRDVSTVRTSPSGEDDENKNLANALDLSESEEDEELEDLVEDFLANNQPDESLDSAQNKLYYFQFPNPFPKFELPPTEAPTAIDVDMVDLSTQKGKQKVTFAENAKEQTLSDDDEERPAQVKTEEDADKPTGGIIGQLEIYRSGLIKMRLGNGIVMEVTAATQPSFLQHAVCLDDAKNRLVVLGEVNRRFIVSPDVDLLLEDMVIQEEKETKRKEEEARIKEESLIRMDD